MGFGLVAGIWLGCGSPSISTGGLVPVDPMGPTTAPSPTPPAPEPSPPQTSTTMTPACSGLPGTPGTTLRDVDIDGMRRTYQVYVPEDLDPDVAAPVVLVFHGFAMSGQIMQDITSWDAVADREGLVVIYPDGADTLFNDPWNVGDGACGAGAFSTSNEDDFAFTLAMLADVGGEQCIDRDRVFATGFSMGAYFTHHLACRGPGIVRAAAPHSGGTYRGDCDNGPIPMMILHGTSDFIIVPFCGDQAADDWRDRNGCSAASYSVEVEGGTCTVSDECDGASSVTHCEFDWMDHGWAGSSDWLFGGGTGYEDGAELAWTLFSMF